MQPCRDGDVTVFAAVTQNSGDGIAVISSLIHRLAMRGLNLCASTYWASAWRLWALFGFHITVIMLARHGTLLSTIAHNPICVPTLPPRPRRNSSPGEPRHISEACTALDSCARRSWASSSGTIDCRAVASVQAAPLASCLVNILGRLAGPMRSIYMVCKILGE